MFAYCNNNPANYIDRSGRNTEAMQWWASTMWWLCCIDAALPIGDIIFTVAAIILMQDLENANGEIEEAYNASKAEAASKASAILDFASTTAPPPPPNKGGKGTQVTSKTLYTKHGKNGFRIDVENPGNRPGQIHLQQGGEKYIYNIADQTFRIGSSMGMLAPDSIQQLLTLPEVIIAIAKGLQILGYF